MVKPVWIFGYCPIGQAKNLWCWIFCTWGYYYDRGRRREGFRLFGFEVDRIAPYKD
jgi:hypothetical protein